MRKVSLIVPVFNGEEYIEETIKSILNQNFQDFELLIIDDGSTDNTNNICKLLQKSDSRINVITTENQGVSSARNTGIKSANAEWICFVDADDRLDEDYLDVYIENLEDPINLMITGYKVLSNNEVIKEFVPTLRNGDKNSFFETFSDLKSEAVFNSVCNKLYNLTIIKNNNLAFDKDLNIAEDVLFNLKYMNFLNEYKIIPNASYNYILNNNDNSLTKKYNKKLMWSIIKQYEETKQFLIDNNALKQENAKTIEEEYFNGIDWSLRLLAESNEELKIRELKYTIQSIKYTNDLKSYNKSFLNKFKLFLIKNKMTYSLYVYYKLNYYRRKII